MTWAKPPARVRQWEGPMPTPRTPAERVHDGKARAIISLPKNPPRRNADYLRWVASQPCAHCGKAPPSQACHSDEGKGMGIKSGDDTAWPGCADSPGSQGCHSIIGSTGMFTREQKRRLEATYAARTRKQAMAGKTWPIGWPTGLLPEE